MDEPKQDGEEVTFINADSSDTSMNLSIPLVAKAKYRMICPRQNLQFLQAELSIKICFQEYNSSTSSPEILVSFSCIYPRKPIMRYSKRIRQMIPDVIPVSDVESRCPDGRS